MEAKQRAELLKDEYIMLQHFYEDIDSKGLTIKSWAITVALAVIGAGVVNKNDMILCAGLVASVVFWYLEGYWRGLSYFFSVRIQFIEKIFQNNTLESELPLQVYSTWEAEYRRVGDRTWEYMVKPFTIFPHLFIAGVIGLLLIF